MLRSFSSSQGSARNAIQLLSNAIQHKPNDIAIEDHARSHVLDDASSSHSTIVSLTYSALERRIAGLAYSLKHKLIPRTPPAETPDAATHVVAIVSPNRAEFIEAYQACLYIGATVIGIPHMFAPSETACMLAHISPTCIIVDDRYVDKVFDAYGGQIGNESVSVVVMDRWVPLEDASAGHASCYSYEALVASVPPSAQKLRLNAYDDYCPTQPAILSMTSGTTGVPKAAIITHQMIIASILESPSYAQNAQMSHHCIPIYNSLSWIGGIVLQSYTLHFGGKIILFDGYAKDRLLPHLCQATALLAMPMVLSDMCDRADVDLDWTRATKASLKTIFYGGAHTPLALQKRLVSTFMPEVAVAQIYGQTEANNITVLPAALHHADPTPAQAALMQTVGVVMRPDDVRIYDPTTKRPCAPGSGMVGEVQVRFDPKYTIAGYYKAPEKTKALFEEGWLRTGDLGTLSSQRFLRLCGRIKDLISTESGYNVYTEEVEDVLLHHAGVVDVAVAAVTSIMSGSKKSEEVCAFVVPAPDTIQHPPNDLAHLANSIRAYGKKHLAPYKVPRHIRFVDVLPRNRNLKVVKGDLVKSFTC